MSKSQFKKIIVTHVQSIAIQKLLKADNGTGPVQELIDAIVRDGEVEEWVAARFANAWRWNHRNEQGNGNEEPKPKQQQEELFFTSAPMPTRKDKGSAGNPENGTGKVAQILQLAASGKSVQEIIEAGYNKSTVYRQVSEWRKREKEKTKATETA